MAGRRGREKRFCLANIMAQILCVITDERRVYWKIARNNLVHPVHMLLVTMQGNHMLPL